MKTVAKNWICKAVFLTVFFSIVFYGSAEIWFESLIFSAIFIFSGIAIWQGSFAKINAEIKILLLPLGILAAYSFLQGFSTLLIQFEFIENSFLFPYSYDLTASFRSGFKILAFVCFIGLVAESLRRNFPFTMWSLLAAGNFFAVFGIARFLLQTKFPESFQYFFLPQLIPNEGFGTFLNQNHFALLMLMTFGLNIGFCWFGKFDKRKRIFLLLVSLISFSAIVLTASRGGIISSFVVVGFLIFFSSTHFGKSFSETERFDRFFPVVKNLLIFVFISIILITGVILIGQDRVLHRFDEVSHEVTKIEGLQTFQRIDAWQAGMGIARENWLYGIGLGGYQYAVSQFINISGYITPKQAHNDYLEFINSGGLIFVTIAAWFLYGFFSIVRKRFDEPENNFDKTARIGAICGIAGIALHSFFDFGLQFTGNLLFFAAFIAITVHRSPVTENRKRDVDEKPVWKKIAVLSLPVILALSTTFFAYSRFELFQAKDNSNIGAVENKFARVPFDAEYFETKADLDFKNKNYDAAQSELKTALFYRPKDYSLWLKLAHLEETLNNSEPAEKSFRQAIELAPLYGEPHFDFGNFLIKTRRTEEGLRELAFAFHRDVRFSDRIIEIIWNESGEDVFKMLDLLSPLNDAEKFNLERFLLNRRAFTSIVQLNCLDKFPPALQDMAVRQFLEKKQIRAAWKIYQNDCTENEIKVTAVIDGGFESGELRRGNGFGWRVGDSVKKKNLHFDEEVKTEGNQSLQFILDGDFETWLISQIVPLANNGNYRLNFSYKTDEMTSGGIPILQIILKNPDAENKVEEIEIKNGKSDWIRETVEFQTNDQTEAVEIRLTTKTCGQQICPVFGKLWIDDFKISHAKK